MSPEGIGLDEPGLEIDYKAFALGLLMSLELVFVGNYLSTSSPVDYV